MPGGLDETVPVPVPLVETERVCIGVPVPPTVIFSRSPERAKAEAPAFEQLTRTRTSPNPLAPLTNGSREPDGPIPATVTSVVPTERVSRSTHVESVQRQIEITCVQVIEDLPM